MADNIVGSAQVRIEPDLAGFPQTLRRQLDSVIGGIELQIRKSLEGLGDTIADQINTGLRSVDRQIAETTRGVRKFSETVDGIPPAPNLLRMREEFDRLGAEARETGNDIDAALDNVDLDDLGPEAREAADSIRRAFEGLDEAIGGEAHRAEQEVDQSFEGMEADARRSFATIASSARDGFSKLTQQVRESEGRLRQTIGGIRGFMREMSSEIGAEFGIRILDAFGRGINALTIDAVSAAADLGEAINVVGLTFGNSSDEIREFGSTAADSMGLAESETLSLTAALGGQLKNLGFAQDEVSGLSQDLVILASDMASAFNREPVEAIEAIQAALRGEIDTIEKFNVFLGATRVEQEAVNLGLHDGTGELTGYAKAQTILSLIMKDTADIQGDFQNTIDALPNLIRRVSASFKDLQTVAGERFLPTAQQVTKGVLDLMPALEESVVDLLDGLRRPLQDAARVILPAIEPLIRGLASAFTDLGEGASEAFIGIEPAVRELGPTLAALGRAVGPIVGELGQLAGEVLPPLLQVVQELAPALSEGFVAGLSTLSALTPVLTAFADLVAVIPDEIIQFAASMHLMNQAATPIRGVLSGIAAAIPSLAASASAASTAVTGLAVAVALYSVAQAAIAEDQREVETQIRGFTAAFEEGEDVVESFTTKLNDLIAAGEALAAPRSGLAKAAEDGMQYSEVLEDASLTTAQFAEVAADGVPAVVDLATELHEAGTISLDTRAALGTLARQFDEAAEATIISGEATGDWTDRQAEAAIEANKLSDGTTNYAGALEDLRAQQEAAAQASDNLTAAVQETEGAVQSSLYTTNQAFVDLTTSGGNVQREFLDFATAAEAAGLSTEQLGLVADEMGVSAESLEAAIAGVNDDLTAMKDAALQTIPSVNEIGTSMEEFTLSGFRDELADAIEAMENFGSNLDALDPFPHLQQFALESGPEYAATLAEAVENGETALLAETEGMIASFGDTYEGLGVKIDEKGQLILEKTGALGEQMDTHLGEGFNPSALVEAKLQAAALAAQTAQTTIKETFFGVGVEARDGFGDGFDPPEGGFKSTVDATIRGVEGRVDQKLPGVRAKMGELGRAGTGGWVGGFKPQDFTTAPITGAEGRITGRSGSMSTAGSTLGGFGTLGFGLGLSGMSGRASSATSDAVAAVTANGGSAWSSGYGVGVQIPAGMEAGIRAGAAAVASAAISAVTAAIGAAKKAAGIASPSKVFMEMGHNMGAGLVIGLEEEAKAVALAGAALSEAAIGATGTGLGITSGPAAVQIPGNAGFGATTGGGGGTVIHAEVNIPITGAATTAAAARAGTTAGKAFLSTIAGRQVRVDARIGGR